MAQSHEQVLLRRVSFSWRRQFIDNSPWIAVLLQAFHNIIGYAVATTPLYAQRQQQASHQNSEASFETQNSSVVPIWQAFL